MAEIAIFSQVFILKKETTTIKKRKTPKKENNVFKTTDKDKGFIRKLLPANILIILVNRLNLW